MPAKGPTGFFGLFKRRVKATTCEVSRPTMPARSGLAESTSAPRHEVERGRHRTMVRGRNTTRKARPSGWKKRNTSVGDRCYHTRTRHEIPTGGFQSPSPLGGEGLAAATLTSSGETHDPAYHSLVLPGRLVRHSPGPRGRTRILEGRRRQGQDYTRSSDVDVRLCRPQQTGR